MDWSHFLGPCPSSMPSTRNCNTPLAHRLTGMPESLSKMFYFHPSGLQFALAQSVFWGFPSSFHAHLASPPLSAVFPIECILHTFTFRSASVLSASVYTPPYSSALFLTYVCSYGPWNPVEGLQCSLLAEGRWDRAALGQTALSPPVGREPGGCRLLQAAAREQHIHSRVVHWSPVH